jgi:hypothetical protein
MSAPSSAIGCKADIICSRRVFPLLTDAVEKVCARSLRLAFSNFRF